VTGVWTDLKNQPSFNVDTMLLLTDGSVMCHEYQRAYWHRLTPDSASSYANGSWQALAPMPPNAPKSQNGPANAPLYFASAVLADGRVFVAGGEYNGTTTKSVDLLAASIYTPWTDKWAILPTPTGWKNIEDAPSCVLPNVSLLMGDINSTNTAIFVPGSDSWIAGPQKNDSSSEETWTLLPDETVLTAEVNGHPNAEKYALSVRKWVSASSIPTKHDLVMNVPNVSIEIGPAILRPDGTVFAIGASGHTAIYTPPKQADQPGSWKGGPDLPEDANNNLLRAFDAPACLLPNGRVLCVAGAVTKDGWAGSPSRFFEYDGTALTEVGRPSSTDNVPTYDCRLLLLPTGEVLLSTCTSHLNMYQPDGQADPAWKPTIQNAPASIGLGSTFPISGTQFNGLSQANSYGDDAQMATNYPIVRVRNNASGTVSYLRTRNHSTMGVATGARVVSTNVT
jgi:hypothetical protein